MTDVMHKQVTDLTLRLTKDLKMLGLSPSKLKYSLEIKWYSKAYYGRYKCKPHDENYTPKVFIYIFKNSAKTELYDYQDILSTVVHEVCHHLQYSDPDFIRLKGVMHNKQFWELYNKYMNMYFEKTQEDKGGRYVSSIAKSHRKGD